MIRPASEDDAGAWADVVAASSPYLVQDAASAAHEMRTDPEGSTRWVAELGGRVVGVARLHVYADEDHASLALMVAPTARRRGVGTALLARTEPRLVESGKAVLRVVVEDDDGARSAASAWGFGVIRRFQMQAVDPRRVVVPAAGDASAEVVPLAELEPRRVWEAHSAVVRDDPSGLSLPMTFEEFLDEWADPRVRPDLSRAALVDGRIAAFTVLGAAGRRAWSDMTGTVSAYRGRGLGLLVKQHALTAAARAGIERCFTGNDASNLPMLAINRRLGYRPFAEPSLWARRVSDGGAGSAGAD